MPHWGAISSCCSSYSLSLGVIIAQILRCRLVNLCWMTDIYGAPPSPSTGEAVRGQKVQIFIVALQLCFTKPWLKRSFSTHVEISLKIVNSKSQSCASMQMKSMYHWLPWGKGWPYKALEVFTNLLNSYNLSSCISCSRGAFSFAETSHVIYYFI